jgi:MFS family permease
VPSADGEALTTAAGLAGLLLIARMADLPPEGEPFTLKSFVSVAKDKNLITGSVLAILFMLVSWATVLGFVQNWANAYVRGFGNAYLGILPVMYLLPNAIVSRFTNKLSIRFGRNMVLPGGFLLIALSCLFYPWARNLWLLFANQVLFGVGMGLIVPLTMASSIETIPNDRRGAAMGVYQAVYGVGMFLGPVIAGKVIEAFSTGGASYAGYAANFRMCALVALAGAAAAWLLTRARVGRH